MIRINTNINTNIKKLIYPKLSYVITGICFDVHNELGKYAKERQYADKIERQLKEKKIPYKRELVVGDSGNIADFFIDDKIILELKAKRILTKEDYYQLQRYLQETRLRLGLLINFRNRYIKPIRVIRIDTDFGNKFRS